MSSRTQGVSLLVAGLALVAAGNLIPALKSAPEGVDPFSLLRPHLSPWLLAQYLVSYDVLGFTKRALIGTIVGLFFEEPRLQTVAWIAAIPTFALAITFALRLPRLAHPGIIAAALLSPATFMQFGFDLGRFDHLIYLAAMAILAARTVPALILVAPLTLLVHEAALLIHLPLVAAVHLVRHGADRFFVLFVAATALVCFAVFAQRTELTLDELQAIYPSAAETALGVYTWSFETNFVLVYEYVASRTDGDVVCLAIGAFYLVCAVLLVRPLLAEVRAGMLCLLACLTPLLLVVIGIDWPRWIALSTLNVFLLATTELARPERALGRRRAWVVLPLMLLISLLGPLGSDQPFPTWR